MRLSYEQSLNRSRSNQLTLSSLKTQFQRNASKIIEICNNHAKKFRPRNQNQSLLFSGDHQEEQQEQISKELKEIYREETKYCFILSRAHVFIDNYHLQIIKKGDPIPIKVQSLGYGSLVWFAQWIGVVNSEYFVGVTDQNWLILVSIKSKKILKYRLKNQDDGSTKKIISVNCHQNYIFVFGEDEYHVLKYKNKGTRSSEKLQMMLRRKSEEVKISKGYGVQYRKLVYVFVISKISAYIWKPEQTLLNVDFSSTLFYQSQDSSIINNIAVHMKDGILTAAFGSNSEVVVKRFTLFDQSIQFVSRKVSPYSRSVNLTIQHVPYLNFIDRQDYLLLAVGFRYQLFFMRIWPELIELSRRIKFPYRIEMAHAFGKENGLVVVLNNNIGDVVKKVVIVTHESKIISFSQYQNYHMLQKYVLEVPLPEAEHHILENNSTILVYKNQEVFLLQKGSIERVVLIRWQDIYNKMKITENIKLLKFLILLKYVDSPFLTKPESFEGLQNFFGLYDDESKQILLEYYHIMNMTPRRINIEKNMQILIPFIIEHKIDNLSLELEQSIMNWCLQNDERLIEEMIIGGSECGWEYAIKNGWIRAFKVMVESGMEIQMPILKLYSMVLFRRVRYVDEQTGKTFQKLNAEGQRYLEQMIEYIKFILGHYFKDMKGDGQNVQFKHVFLIIFKPEIWNFITRFAQHDSLSIITYIFMYPSFIKEVGHYSYKDLRNFKEIFGDIMPRYPTTHAEKIFSHLSKSFKQENPELSTLLLKEHSRLQLLKYKEIRQFNPSSQQNHNNVLNLYQLFNLDLFDRYQILIEISKYKEAYATRNYFNFKKQYLKDMLILLIKDNHAVLEDIFQLFEENQISMFTRTIPIERQAEMIFFLISIWLQIYCLIIDSNIQQRSNESDSEIIKHIKIQIRLLLSEIEATNHESHYLILHTKLSINSSNQYTLNILRTYLKCSNIILQSRVFFWLRKNIPQSGPLQDQFIKHLKQMIQIDKEQSRDILKAYFVGREKQIIKKLDQNPPLQLEYVELVIQGGNEHLQAYYTNLHIKLLLKLDPYKIIDIFRSSFVVQYDLHQALSMTESSQDFKQKNDILIFLYEIEGDIPKCINTYLQTFKKYLTKYKQISQKYREDDPFMAETNKTSTQMANFWYTSNNYMTQLNDIVLEFQRKFLELIQLIFRQVQIKYEYFLLCLNQFSNMLSRTLVENYKFKHDYVNLLVRFFGNFIVSMFERTYLHDFSKWIQEYKGEIWFFSHLQGYMIEVYNKITVYLVTLKSTSSLERKVLVKQISQTLKKIQFCISSTAICMVCNQQFKNEGSVYEALLFNCGHLYHKRCIDSIHGQDYCYYCVFKNPFKYMMEHEQLHLVDLLDRFYSKQKFMAEMGGSIPIRQKETLLSLDNKRKNRMRLYDKKASSIETQAEILDLKMQLDEYYKVETKK